VCGETAPRRAPSAIQSAPGCLQRINPRSQMPLYARRCPPFIPRACRSSLLSSFLAPRVLVFISPSSCELRMSSSRSVRRTRGSRLAAHPAVGHAGVGSPPSMPSLVLRSCSCRCGTRPRWITGAELRPGCCFLPAREGGGRGGWASRRSCPVETQGGGACAPNPRPSATPPHFQ
jgi:hypothetical protein